MVNLYLTPLKSKPEKTSFNQETIVTLSFESKMTAKAVLLCRPNSHPFQERTLVLDQPVKVGRSVARARPAPNNGIFDCKVLSRNHALLWYENGKFFLQDTKSSNGTFVNNQRLSKGSDESPPREVCSGDIVQFGVDVMENSRKVTHGCIVATLKLFLPDGKEAKASPSTVMLPTCPSTISQQDLYQLAQYLQEAVHREQVLQDKIVTLQKLVTNTEESANLSWKAMIDEDRLLSRLEILESQFRACSKNLSEDALREEVIRLQEDKDRYQVTSKESLKKVLLENMEVAHKLQDAERVLMNTENEYKNLKQVHDVAQNEIKDLAEKYNAGLKEIQDLNEKLVQLDEEKSVNEDEKKPSIIINEFSENDLTVKKENYKSIIGDSQGDLKSLISTQGIQVNINESDNDIEGEFKESEMELVESKTKVADINKLLDKAQVEAVKSMNKVSQLEVNLQDAKLKTENNTDIIIQLQEKIEQLEQKLNAAKETKESSDRLTIVYKSEVEPVTETITLPLPGRRKSSEIHNGELSALPVSPNQLQSEICKLKEILQETRENKIQAEKEVSKYKSEIEDARDGIKKANDDCNFLRLQLQTAQQQVTDKATSVARLRDQLKVAESTSVDGQLQLNSLKDKLSLDEQRYKQKQEEIENLRQQLSEVMHNYKQSHNEAEQLRNKFETLTKQVEEHSSELIDEEYSSLRKSHQQLEAEINHVKAENTKLRENNVNAVQNECHPDSSLREDSPEQEDVEATKRKLMEAYAHIVNLKETCAAYNAERTRLHHEMNSNQEFHMPAYTLYPLLVALFGVLVVFYPKLMLITATLEPSMPP